MWLKLDFFFFLFIYFYFDRVENIVGKKENGDNTVPEDIILVLSTLKAIADDNFIRAKKICGKWRKWW